jgi:protein-tyrosine kinase
VNFIAKALEKAKSLHQLQVAPAPSVHLEPSPEPFPAVNEVNGFVETPGEIRYTCTRNVAVDMDILRRNRLIVAGNHKQLGEAYKLLRTQLLHRTAPKARNTLMVTGPLPNEGKTLTAINLAIAISQKVGQTVLLVDADLRTPSIQRYLDLPLEPGLVEYLTSGYPIAESLVHPQGLSNLVVLPAGNPTPQSPELLSSPLMADLVKELKHFYPERYVLFDLPPLLYADPLAFAPLVDGIILVVEAGNTPQEEITRTLEMLKEFPVLGFVLNKMDFVSQAYDPGYQYGADGNSSKKFKFPWLK